MSALKQDNIVQFKREAKVSDRFEKGYVMFSRLYLDEVYPFLSPAAKDAYTAINCKTTGFNKDSDHISYSQMQGGKLIGAKKTSPATIRKGIKELLDYGVISLVSEDARRGNEYKINEVSLVEYFKNKSTTSKNEVLQKMKCEDFNNCSASTSKNEDTIDNIIDNSIDINIHTQVEEKFTSEIQEIFEFWKTTFNKPKAKLGDKRKGKIKARLNQGYSVDDIKLAIVNCSKSEFHVKGGHIDLELICRDETKVDSFMQRAQVPGNQNQIKGPMADFYADFYAPVQQMRDIEGECQ